MLYELPPHEADTDFAPAFRSGEMVPQASFDQYRAICTDTDSFRYVGLMNAEDYDRAVRDPRTVFSAIDGVSVPALAPLEYESGYDTERCKSLTGESAVMLLSIPLAQVREGALRADNLSGGSALPEKFAIVVEEPVNDIEGERESDHAQIARALSDIGTFTPHEFRDERLIGQDDHENAWMALYACSVGPTPETREARQETGRLLDARNLYFLKVRYTVEQRLSAGTGDARSDEELKAQLVDEYLAADADLVKVMIPKSEPAPAAENPRKIPDGVRAAISEALDQSFDTLEDRIIEQNRRDAEAEHNPATEFEEAWATYRKSHQLPEVPAEDSNATYLYTPQELWRDQALRDQLWAIAEQGFDDKLGMYHPVYMTETRDHFESFLMAEGMYVAVRYHDGKPVCFGSMSFNMEACPWLDTNQGTFAREISEARDHDEVPIYFFDIVSNSEGMSFSGSVFRLFTDLCTYNGRNYRLMLESTNLSSLYIPRLLERLFRSSAARILGEDQKVQLVDQTDYWYLAPTA